MKKISLHKSKRVLEWSIAFWLGFGLMGIINILKLTYTQTAMAYDWIMFGVALVAIAACVILMKKSGK